MTRSIPHTIYAALLIFACATSEPAVADKILPSPKDAVPLQLLEDAPRTLDPVRKRTEAEDDGLHAVVLYAAGRLHERKLELPQALRYYQRTIRYDPDNRDALLRLLYLERRLERHTELARYSVQLAATKEADALTLLRAYVYLQDDERQSEAIKLYQQKMTQGANDNREPAWIELHKMAGQTCLQNEEFAAAAAAFGIVDDVLSDPDKYGLNDAMVKLVSGDNPAKLWVLAGEAFLRAGQSDRAQAALTRADAIDPELQLRHYAEAQIHAAEGRDQEALTALQAYFDAKATKQENGPYKLLKKILTKQKQQAKLVERLEQLYAADSDNPELAYFLANQQIDQGQLAAAQVLLEKMIREHPRGDAYRGLVRIYRSTANAQALLDTAGELIERTGGLSVLGDEREAIAENDALMEKMVAVAREGLGDEKATLSFGQRMAIALLASEAADFELAAEFFELAVAANAEQRALVYEAWGMALLRAERNAEAVVVFQTAIDNKVIPEDNPVFHYYLSGALAIEQRYEEAVAAARHAAETTSDSAEFVSRLAWVYYIADRYEDSAAVYQDVIDRFDENRGSYDLREQVRDARMTLSHLHTMNDDTKTGVELLEQVLDEFPDDVGAANDLGYLWSVEGVHLQRAHRMITNAVAAEPENAAYRDSLGWVLYRLGRPEEALVELQRAIAVDEPDGVVLDHLGDVQAALGQDAVARQSWQRALKAFEEAKDEKMTEALRAKLKPAAATAPP